MANISYRDQVGAIGALAVRKASLANPVRSTLATRGWMNSVSRGTGMLAGVFPDAPTTVGGIPVSAQVLVRYRAATPGDPMDGMLVAQTTSSPAGEWEIQNLDSGLLYDVSARYPGENDALQTRVKPFDEARFVSSTLQIAVGVPLDEPLPLVGGEGELTAVFVSGTYPSGVSLVGDRLQGSWPTGTIGRYPITFDVTDDVATHTRVLTLDLFLLPLALAPFTLSELRVGVAESVQFEASGGEGPYSYGVTAGTLPAGLSLNGSTGVLSGTPSVVGEYAFTVTVTDVRSQTSSKTVSGRAVEAHKYWRINISASNNHASVTEIEMASEVGGADLCSGGTIIASGTYPASDCNTVYAFDDVTSGGNCWASNVSTSGWIGYSFASPVSIAAVRIWARVSFSQSPKDFSIQYSDDGVTYTTVKSYTNLTSWPNGFVEFSGW